MWLLATVLESIDLKGLFGRLSFKTFNIGYNMHYKGKTDKIYYIKIKKLIFIKRKNKGNNRLAEEYGNVNSQEYIRNCYKSI